MLDFPNDSCEKCCCRNVVKDIVCFLTWAHYVTRRMKGLNYHCILKKSEEIEQNAKICNVLGVAT